MKSHQKLTIKAVLAPTVLALGMLFSQSVFAQVTNNSGTPVAGLLVGDIAVGASSPEASVGRAIENLCPQLAVRQNTGQNSAIQTDLFQRCGDLIFDTTPQTGNLRQVAP